MSKIKSLFLSCAVAFCSLCAVVFAGCGYTPAEGKKYYKVDDICRVIELDESKTRIVENYGIEALMPMFEESALTPISVKVNCYYYKNSLFFKSDKRVNKDGALCVYDCIGVDKHSEVVEKSFYTGTHTTFNAVYETEKVHSFSKWDQPRGVVYGLVSDVTEYTFNFVDYDRRGNEVESGTFTVMLCTETPHEGFFEINGN